MIFQIPKNVCKNLYERLLEWVMMSVIKIRLMNSKNKSYLLKSGPKVDPQKMGARYLSGLPRFFVYSSSIVAGGLVVQS